MYGNEFRSFRTVCESLSTELKRSVVLDGGIVCPDGDGKSRFYDLLFRRGKSRFVASDLLHCDGEDLTTARLSNACACFVFCVGSDDVLARQYAQALTLCKKALDIAPDFFPAHLLVGLVSEQEGRFADAIESLEEAWRASGENVLT